MNLLGNRFSMNPYTFFLFYVTSFCEYFTLILSFNIFSLPFFTINTFLKTLLSNFNFNIKLPINIILDNIASNNTNTDKNLFLVQDIATNLGNDKNNFLESSSDTRYNRFFNVLVNYDYKTGHYIGN
jgi:hypothetical protein